MPITLPVGAFATAPQGLGIDFVLAGPRVTSYRVELLDPDENLIGTLDTASTGSGEVAYSAYSSVKGAGSITVVDDGTDIDWLNVRLRPVATLSGANLAGTDDIEQRCGIWLPVAPVETWDSTGRSWTIELLDKATILDQDIANGEPGATSPYVISAGTNVIEAIRTIIEETGETTQAIEPADLVMAVGLIWDIGTTRLRIINDLLALANYFSIWTDGSGQFRCEPYKAPADRTPIYQSLDPLDPGGLMSPEWTRDRDYFSIPNRYMVVGTGDETTEAPVAVATDEDEASPYSYPSRGRWITAVETGVESLDTDVLQAIADQRLHDAQTVTQTMEVQHVFLPELRINSVIEFTNPGAGLDSVLCSVTNTSIPFDPTGACKSTLRVVASS